MSGNGSWRIGRSRKRWTGSGCNATLPGRRRRGSVALLEALTSVVARPPKHKTHRTDANVTGATVVLRGRGQADLVYSKPLLRCYGVRRGVRVGGVDLILTSWGASTALRDRDLRHPGWGTASVSASSPCQSFQTQNCFL